ncbi:MAG: hypothetical protein ACYTA5_11440 [Planctomycetota bacterium]|jgi:hypothetical protein
MISNHSENIASTEDSVIGPLPEYWPIAHEVKPVRAVWLPWPVAVVFAPLFWLFPKRMGSHFAESRWLGAIVAHFCWTIYGVSCLVNAYIGKHYSWMSYFTGQTPGQKDPALWPGPSWSQLFRTPIAALFNGIDDVSQGINPLEQLFICLSVILAAEVAVVVFSSLLMPYVAAGEGKLRLFARCVKLTLWSTTSLVFLGLVLQGIELFAGSDFDNEYYVRIAVSVYIAWFIWIWIRSGTCYAGPSEGPGWEARRPLCEACGYILTGLTAKDNCPECGLAVAESLPQTRRPPSFAQATSILGRFVGFWQTCFGALFGRGFYKRLAIHENFPAARRFAIYAAVVCGPLFCFLGLVVAELVVGNTEFSFTDLSFIAGLVTLLLSVLVLFLLLLGLLGLSGSRFCYCPLRPLALALFYFLLFTLAVADGD